MSAADRLPSARRNRARLASIERAHTTPELSDPRGADTVVRVSDLIHDVSKLRETYFEQQCRVLGITRAQWWMIYKLSSYAPGSPNQTELAQHIGVGTATAGETLSRAEKAGYLRREDDPQNRRAKRVAIMASGSKLVASMRDVATDYSDAVMAGLSEQDEALLLELLGRIKHNLLTLLG